MKTANIIRNGLNNGWKQKYKLIYKNLSKVLIESKVDYFQRPAENTGKSIKFSNLDSKVSSGVH
jgi:hypothetical protein